MASYDIASNVSIKFSAFINPHKKDGKIEKSGEGTYTGKQLKKAFLDSVLAIYKNNAWGKTYASSLAFFEDRLNKSFDASLDWLKKANELTIQFDVLEDGYKSGHSTTINAYVVTDPLNKDFRAWVLDLRSFNILARGEVKDKEPSEKPDEKDSNLFG